jgi:protein SCO1/2/putative membrane protein
LNAETIEGPAAGTAPEAKRGRSYGSGIAVVVGTVAVSALLCVLTVGDQPRGLEEVASTEQTIPAGERLYLSPRPVGPFRFTERSGREITEADLEGRPWIADFIFTRCKATCPVLTSKMKAIQGQLRATDTRLVSLSVDPEHDTPRVLNEYAKTFDADPDRWWFLSGEKDATYRLIREGFLQHAEKATADEVASGSEEVRHDVRLALVDRHNRLVGLYDSTDPDAVRRLVARAKVLGNPLSVLLPTLNASLNGACAILLVLALAFILRRRYRAHAACMIAAVGVSAVFLACYLGYHFLVVGGSVPFLGVGRPVRVLYFTILLSHTLLAVAALPLILLTIVRAARKRFEAHKAVSRVTFPIWLYVSITGVVVYWMLYRMDFAASAAM